MPQHFFRTPLQTVLQGSWLALLLLLSAPLLLNDTASIGLWLMQCIPLVLTLPGIRSRSSRALQWLCFLVLFYFTQGVLQLFSPGAAQRWLGALTILFCLVLFTAAIVSLRRKTP
jgi:uncharacterized membrane protein